MPIDGPGIYLMVNGTEALITAWVPLDWHSDEGHWIGIVDPRQVDLRSPFSSWRKDGRDCDGYHAWDITVKLEER